MKRIFVFAVFLFSFASLTSVANDTLKISMKSSFGARGLYVRLTVPTTKIDDINSKGLPVCENYQISACILNRDQFIYDSYKKGTKSESDFLRDVNRYKIDTSFLSKKPLTSYVRIFSGLQKNNKIVIIDEDNDNDFSNNTIYKFDTLSTNKWFKGDTIETLPLVNISYEKFIRNKIEMLNAYIRIKPYDYSYNYKNDMERKLNIYTINNLSKEGEFKINDEEFKVNINLNFKSSPSNFSSGYFYRIQKKGYEFSSDVFEENKKQVIVKGHTFKVIKYNSDLDSLEIVYYGFQANPEGGYLGFKIPSIKGSDSEGNLIQIETQLRKKRYILLDFWGSWCTPCIKSIPDVKKLYNKLDLNKVQLIGVDFEYNDAGFKVAKEIIEKYSMTWEQIAETPLNTKKGFKVAEALDVKSYPTLLLISPDGMVMFRETGERTTIKVEEYLKKVNLLLDN